jgi:hypothetical protein
MSTGALDRAAQAWLAGDGADTARQVTPVTPPGCSWAGGVIVTLGGDPGDTAGLFLGWWSLSSRKLTDYRSWQCGANGALELLGWVLADWGRLIGAAGIEDFRAGPKSVKLHGTSAPATSRMVTAMADQVRAAGIPVSVRPATTIKTWADDGRLRESGLLAATSGMPKHARDASRVALFTACADLGMRDPRGKVRGKPD